MQLETWLAAFANRPISDSESGSWSLIIDRRVAYVPLHVEDPSGEVFRGPEGIEMPFPFRPRVPVPKALAEHRHLLIVGAPGSGKSTLVAYLAASAAHGTLSRDLGWPEDPLPFVVPVRSISRGELDAGAIAEVNDCRPELVKSAVGNGRALILVDGLDEAVTEKVRGLQEACVQIASEKPDNMVVVTTRPAAKPETEPASGRAAPASPALTATELAAMTRDEVDEFIDKWCLAAEISIHKERHPAEEKARQAAEDLKARLRSSRSIERLAETPLMCTIICVVHRFLGQRIPERRVALYEACTNVLLYEWDRAKFPDGAKVGQLDAPAKRSLLGCLALHMHQKKVSEIPADVVIEQFGQRLPVLDRPAGEAEQILAEIRDRSGLLVEKRPGAFAFSHLMFQEYLTAVEWVGRGAVDQLVQRYEDPWWHEVIVLAAGFPGFPAGQLVRKLLAADDKEVSTGTFLAAQCVETAVEIDAGVRKRVEKRLSKLIPPKTLEDTRRLIELGQLPGPALARALPDADPAHTFAIAYVLGWTTFEPAVEKLVSLIKDPRLVGVDIFGSGGGGKTSVGNWMVVVLLGMASRSAIAFEALRTRGQDPKILRTLRTAAEFSGGGPVAETAKKLLESQST